MKVTLSIVLTCIFLLSTYAQPRAYLIGGTMSGSARTLNHFDPFGFNFLSSGVVVSTSIWSTDAVRGIAVTRDGNTRFLSMMFSTGAPHAIEVSSNRITGSVHLCKQIIDSSELHGVALSPDERTLYVATTSPQGDGRLVAFDVDDMIRECNARPIHMPQRPRVEYHLIPSPANLHSAPLGSSPHSVAVSPDGSYVMVTNSASNTVSVVQTNPLGTVRNCRVGANPVGIDISPDGERAYVANWSDGDVTILDLNNIINCSETTKPPSPFSWNGAKPGQTFQVRVAPDNTKIYVTSKLTAGDTPVVTQISYVPGSVPAHTFAGHIDLTQGGVNRRFHLLGTNGASLDITPDGSRLLVPMFNTNQAGQPTEGFLLGVDTTLPHNRRTSNDFSRFFATYGKFVSGHARPLQPEVLDDFTDTASDFRFPHAGFDGVTRVQSVASSEFPQVQNRLVTMLVRPETFDQGGAHITGRIDATDGLVVKEYEDTRLYQYSVTYGRGVDASGSITQDWLALDLSDYEGIRLTFGQNHTMRSVGFNIHVYVFTDFGSGAPLPFFAASSHDVTTPIYDISFDDLIKGNIALSDSVQQSHRNETRIITVRFEAQHPLDDTQISLESISLIPCSGTCP